MENTAVQSAVVITTVFLIIAVLRRRRRMQRSIKVAPGPKTLPIIGSIHHLFGQRLLHRALRSLSSIYGPVMRLKLGEVEALIISSAKAAKQVMATHDMTFSSRPISPTVRILFPTRISIAFTPYGDYYRQIRRICSLELLSPDRVRSFSSLREEEVSHLVRTIAAAPPGATINLSSELTDFSNNIISVPCIGSRCDDREEFLTAIKEIQALLTGFSLLDLFPSVPNFVIRITGIPQRLERCRQKMNRIVEKIVQDHIEKRADGSDLIDRLLRTPLSKDHIKAIIIDLLIAGSETMTTTLEWAMSELVRNPWVMKKAQGQVREGKGLDKGEGCDYLQLVIKETLRLHVPTPFLLPRENREDCEVMGYDVPAGTMVMVNAWAIGTDPRFWDDPEAFRPERFEERSQLDVKGANFELIPFGAGRRMCPGMHFGLANLEIALARLLYHFDWKYPAVEGEELDMSEHFGVTVRRKSPLCLQAIPVFN